MEIILHSGAIIVLGALMAINLFKEYEKKIRVIPEQKGIDEGKNPIINLIDFLLLIGYIVIEFINLKWYWAILHFIVLYFLTPFITQLLGEIIPVRFLSKISLSLKAIFLILILIHIIF